MDSPQETTNGTVILEAILTLPQADWGLLICSAVSSSFSTFASASALPQVQFLHAFLVAPTSQSPTGETQEKVLGPKLELNIFTDIKIGWRVYDCTNWKLWFLQVFLSQEAVFIDKFWVIINLNLRKGLCCFLKGERRTHAPAGLLCLNLYTWLKLASKLKPTQQHEQAPIQEFRPLTVTDCTVSWELEADACTSTNPPISSLRSISVFGWRDIHKIRKLYIQHKGKAVSKMYSNKFQTSYLLTGGGCRALHQYSSASFQHPVNLSNQLFPQAFHIFNDSKNSTNWSIFKRQLPTCST